MREEPQPTSACRVVLVDSRDERRKRMRPVIDGDDSKVILVGEADSSAAAIVVIDEQRADAVILDVQMPVSEGLKAITSLRERYPQLGIVVCSFDLDPTTVELVLAHGADSCLAKPLRRSEVHNALGSVRSYDRPNGGHGPPLAALAGGATAR